MRTLILIAATAVCTFAQTSAGGPRSLNPVGQGNILRPGIPMSGPPRSRPNIAAAPYTGRTIYVPYAIPIDPFYSGYYGGYGYGTPYAPYGPYDPTLAGYPPGASYGAPYGASYGATPGQPPTVVINQNFQPDSVHPLVRDYSNTPLPQAGAAQTPPAQDGAAQGGTALRDDEPTIFLIAMKDHTIYPVIAYWVDRDTLNYVTVESAVKKVPLDQVDRDLSIQLNDQRNVEFRLPAPQK